MPSSDQAVLLLALLAVAAIVALVLISVAWQRERRRSQDRIEQLLGDQDKNLLDARRDSVEKSRSTLKGQIAEQMAPLLPGFLYHPADARFLGDPIDYVVFSGYAGLRDGGGAPQDLEVVLLEVKQGSSVLSPSQKAIARAVQEGRMRFEVCRIRDDGTVSSETWRPGRGAAR
jgi:predicted Holliday junction resolvase-like endonuclease